MTKPQLIVWNTPDQAFRTARIVDPSTSARFPKNIFAEAIDIGRLIELEDVSLRLGVDIENFGSVYLGLRDTSTNIDSDDFLRHTFGYNRHDMMLAEVLNQASMLAEEQGIPYFGVTIVKERTTPEVTRNHSLPIHDSPSKLSTSRIGLDQFDNYYGEKYGPISKYEESDFLPRSSLLREEFLPKLDEKEEFLPKLDEKEELLNHGLGKYVSTPKSLNSDKNSLRFDNAVLPSPNFILHPTANLYVPKHNSNR